MIKLGQKGQAGASMLVSAVILVFIIVTVGRILFNATALDPDTSDGGLNSQGGNANPTVQDSLMRVGLYTMGSIVILALLASVAVKFF